MSERKLKDGDYIKFVHGKEMLRHAMWLVISWIQGRNYRIVAPDSPSACSRSNHSTDADLVQVKDTA